jgi:formylglycine-generating enzyme required for sulfatase activity
MKATSLRSTALVILLAAVLGGCTFVLPFDDFPQHDAATGPDARPDAGDASVWCTPDAVASCYTGEASSLVGACQEGQKICTSFGIWGDYAGEVTPAMQCAGRECGGDGCGGECGTCEGDIVCETVTGICLRDAMQLIDATQFLQGSPDLEDGHQTDELAHLVTLTPYAIDRYEVTNQAYLQCVQEGQCDAPLACDSGTPVWNPVGGYPAEVAHHPVVCVSWAMAAAYCAYREKRLCTEAEWERACVYDATHRIWPWGDTPGNLQYRANCDEGYCFDGHVGTAPVGSFLDGNTVEGDLFDLAGNVSEWVLDWYAAGYYAEAPELDPQGPCDGASPCESRSERVHRGGSYLSSVRDVRCARRRFETATAHPAFVGIRCCRDATGL